VPPTLLSEPRAFLQLLTAARVTRLVAVPAFLWLLIAVAANLSPNTLPPLSLLVSSGEPLSVGLWRALCDTFPGVRVLNLYGMTEAAADSTCFDPEEAVRVGAWAGPNDPDAHLPIGYPIHSTWVALVDEDMQLITSDDRTGCVGLGLVEVSRRCV
jgi:acyl-CoA synthetase (AMP-forming)/AMP-acid ligase II